MFFGSIGLIGSWRLLRLACSNISRQGIAILLDLDWRRNLLHRNFFLALLDLCLRPSVRLKRRKEESESVVRFSLCNDFSILRLFVLVLNVRTPSRFRSFHLGLDFW